MNRNCESEGILVADSQGSLVLSKELRVSCVTCQSRSPQQCSQRAAKQTQIRTPRGFNWIVFGFDCHWETSGLSWDKNALDKVAFNLRNYETFHLASEEQDNELQPPLNEFGLGRMQNAKSNDCKSVSASPSSLVCSFLSYMRQQTPDRFFVNCFIKITNLLWTPWDISVRSDWAIQKKVLIKSPTWRERKNYHTNNEM